MRYNIFQPNIYFNCNFENKQTIFIFDENHPYEKTFNPNTVKISYSCTSKFRSKIVAHNNKILNKNNKSKTKDKLFNCSKEPCPLNNQCLISNITYRATVISNKATKQCVGSTINSFKQVFI